MNACRVCALPESSHDGTEEHRFVESHIPASTARSVDHSPTLDRIARRIEALPESERGPLRDRLAGLRVMAQHHSGYFPEGLDGMLAAVLASENH